MKLLFSNPVSFAAAARRHRGINPPDHKQASLRSVLMDMPLPRLLYFPLCLTGKEPAYPLVKPGYSVLKGQLLAASTDGNDNLVHASTSGRIVALASHPRPDPFGSNGETLILEADGEDRWIALHPATDWQTLPATEIRSRICRAGIDERNDCGLSRWNHARQPEILIINALETEPYLTADQALIRSHAKELLTGAGILQLACGALRCIIAITSEKSDAIAALYTALQESGQQAGIEVMVLPPRYPITDRQLIDAVTGGRVPVEQPESERGAVLADVTTTMAVRDAVIDGRPMLSRVTTVCGNTLRTPKNFRALLGTPVGFLLELCGIDYQNLDRLVMGGSLTGFTLHSFDVPIVKSSTCVIAAAAGEFPAPVTAGPCIRCDACVPSCPVGLLPQNLYQAVKNERQDLMTGLRLDDCIECGACAYVCPDHIPLVQYFRAGKAVLSREARQIELSEYRSKRFEARRQRLARDTAMRRGSRRRSVARPENPDIQDSGLKTFSRTRAREEIAAAVARVQQRRRNAGKATARPRDPDQDGRS